VCDASAIVAALLDAGDDGQWASARITNGELYGPTLLPFECTNVVRRLELDKSITPDQAVQAFADLRDLSIEYWPYEPLAGRIWDLRKNLSSYDAAYIALAEEVDATVVTLDRRMQRAPGIRCEVASPRRRR
jgi:predicted nucleic acid-binding protein